MKTQLFVDSAVAGLSRRRLFNESSLFRLLWIFWFLVCEQLFLILPWFVMLFTCIPITGIWASIPFFTYCLWLLRR